MQITSLSGCMLATLHRVIKTVFLENHCFRPYANYKQVGLPKSGENDDFTLYPQTQGVVLLRPTDEDDVHGGCHLRKTTVCQSHRFRHPE